MKVLYVDDSRFTRSTLQRLLLQAGHEAHGVSGGAEALDVLSREKPDLLITDLLMEGISGKEVIRKARDIYPDLVVIVVTADVQNSTQSECLALGAAVVCSKNVLYADGQAFMKVLAEVTTPKPL